MDKKVIESRLKKLEHAVSRFKKIKKLQKTDYLNNQDYQDIEERYFHVAIQTCIGTANYIVAGAGPFALGEEENVLTVLGKNGSTTKSLAEKNKEMVSFRNIVVYAYLYVMISNQIRYTKF